MTVEPEVPVALPEFGIHPVISSLRTLIFLRGFIAVKRHHDQGNSSKGKHLSGVAYSFRGLVYYHGRTHRGMQTDMVLEKELRVLHLAGSRKWSATLGSILNIYET